MITRRDSPNRFAVFRLFHQQPHQSGHRIPDGDLLRHNQLRPVGSVLRQLGGGHHDSSTRGQ